MWVSIHTCVSCWLIAISYCKLWLFALLASYWLMYVIAKHGWFLINQYMILQVSDGCLHGWLHTDQHRLLKMMALCITGVSWVDAGYCKLVLFAFMATYWLLYFIGKYGSWHCWLLIGKYRLLHIMSLCIAGFSLINIWLQIMVLCITDFID